MKKVKPPISKELPDFKFPEFNYVKLNDGLEIYEYPDNEQTLTTVKIISHAGSCLELQHGLASITAQMMSRGTKTKSATELFEVIDGIGASYSSSVSWDESTFSITCLSEFSAVSLDLLTDIFLNPSFRTDELTKIRRKQVSIIQQENADPEYIAQTAFLAGLFPGHPYCRQIYGTAGSVKVINKKNLLNWYTEFLRKARITLIIAGNTKENSLLQLTIDKFQSAGIGAKADDCMVFRGADFNRKIVLINKKDSHQVNLRLGKLTIGRDSKLFTGLQLANAVFGGYFQSRLNHILRESLGLTYGVFSTVNARKFASSLVVGTAVNSDAALKSADIIIREMNKINTSPIPLKEIAPARMYILGSFLRGIETPQQVASLLKSMAIYNLGDDFFNKFFQDLSTISRDELMAAQRECFSPDNIVIAASGDIDKLQKEFESYGEILFCDENGNII